MMNRTHLGRERKPELRRLASTAVWCRFWQEALCGFAASGRPAVTTASASASHRSRVSRDSPPEHRTWYMGFTRQHSLRQRLRAGVVAPCGAGEASDLKALAHHCLKGSLCSAASAAVSTLRVVNGQQSGPNNFVTIYRLVPRPDGKNAVPSEALVLQGHRIQNQSTPLPSAGSLVSGLTLLGNSVGSGVNGAAPPAPWPRQAGQAGFLGGRLNPINISRSGNEVHTDFREGKIHAEGL